MSKISQELIAADKTWSEWAATRIRHFLPPGFPKIVCLCGSTRFFVEFQEASLRETVAGNIVLSIGCNLRSDNQLWADPLERDAIKKRLDELHFRKIEIADEILILNVGGYIGESTHRELCHAIKFDKVVRFLEPPGAEIRRGARDPDSLPPA